MSEGPALPASLRVLVRGWLHGNVVLLGGERAALFDTGYHTGVSAIADAFAPFADTLDAVRDVYLTHLHSDHAGGAAELKAQTGCRIWAHPKAADIVARWDRRALWLDHTEQEMPRFSVDETLAPDTVFVAGELAWRAISLPGHATGGLGFFCESSRILVSGDALWRDGLGAPMPWFDGEQVFDDAARALQTIEALAPRIVIPGHGQPFIEVEEALNSARRVLHSARSQRERLFQRSVVGLAAFFLRAVPEQSHAQFRAALTRILAGRGDSPSQADIDTTLRELVTMGIVETHAGGVRAGARLR